MSKITVSQRQPFLVERFHVKNSIFLDRFHEIFLPKRPPLWEFGPSSNHFHGKINSGLLILQKKLKAKLASKETKRIKQSLGQNKRQPKMSHIWWPFSRPKSLWKWRSKVRASYGALYVGGLSSFNKFQEICFHPISDFLLWFHVSERNWRMDEISFHTA